MQIDINSRKQLNKPENYAAFYSLLNRLPTSDREALKESIVSQYTDGRTTSLREMTLKEFTIQAISKGSDDVGKVHMQVEYDGHMYYGFGANTDIIAASVEAYIDCINKFKH